MFCMYCGKPTEGDKRVCDSCAAARSGANAQRPNPAPQQAQPFGEAAFQLNTPPVRQERPVQPQAPQRPQQPKKPAKAKKSKTGVIIAAVAAVVAVAVLAVVLLAPGFFVRTFGSPDDYMEHVEKQSAAEITDMVSGIYGALTGKTEEKADTNGINAEVHLEMDEALLSVLAVGITGGYSELDLSWLTDISLQIATAAEGDMGKGDIGIGLGDKQIATLSVIADLAKQTVWMGIPELSKDYLRVDLATLMEESGMDLDSVMDQKDEIMKVLEKLPSDEVVSGLLNKYIGIALSHIEDAEKDTKTMKAGGVKQELTELSVKITEKDIYEIAIEVLETLKDDEEAQDLFAVIMEIMATVDPYSVPDTSAKKLFKDGIKAALSELEDMVDDAQKSNYIKVKTYVDGSDAIVGHTLSISGQDQEISYITVWDGDEFAFEALLGDVEITGEGTRKKGLIEAEYVLLSYGQEIMTLEVSDWDEKAAEEGYFKGTLLLAPSEAMFNEMTSGAMTSAASSLVSNGIALELNLNMSEKSSEIDIGLVAGGNRMLGMSFNVSSVAGAKVSKPSSDIDLIVDGMPDQEALKEWILDMDFDTVLKNISKAGVPSEYVDMLEVFVAQLDMVRG